VAHDERPISALLIEGQGWDAESRELDFKIKFQDSEVGRIHFEEMKTCTPDRGSIKISKMETSENGEKTINTAQSIEHLLKRFSEPEQLDKDNMWYCSGCKEHVQAFKKIQIYKAPKYLILHMKKSKGEMMLGSRLSESGCKNVQFPIDDLDMTPFVLNKTTIKDYGITTDEFADENNEYLINKITEESTFDSTKPMIYDLYGVVNHYGSMSFGHYTGYVKNQEVWRTYDDSSVKNMSVGEINTEAAYVLFYKRRLVVE
jgi:ubiquitin carboxyl-terminal hydrolase 4/11/15